MKYKTRTLAAGGYRHFYGTSCVSVGPSGLAGANGGSARSADRKRISTVSVLCNMLMDQKHLARAVCS